MIVICAFVIVILAVLGFFGWIAWLISKDRP